MKIHSFAFLMGLGGLACSAVHKEPPCTLLACETQTRLERHVTLAPTDVDKLVYEVCRNDRCAKARLMWQSAGAEFTCSVDGLSADDRALMTCRLTTGDWEALRSAGPSSNTPFDFTLVGLARANTEELKDGDHYSFKLSRVDSSVPLVEASGSVTYETLQPNGPECAPTCKISKLP